MIKSVIYEFKTVSTYNYKHSESQMFILTLFGGNWHNMHIITITYAVDTMLLYLHTHILYYVHCRDKAFLKNAFANVFLNCYFY